MEKQIRLGSVSSGTMRKEDLIPCFIDEILYYNKNNGLALEIQNRTDQENYFDTEESDFDLESLFDELNNLCDLSYVYFGAHCGDGSDYGYWIDFDIIEYNFDGLKVDDLNNIPDNYTGEAIYVNDHGNTTLYSCKNGKLTEIWAVV